VTSREVLVLHPPHLFCMPPGRGENAGLVLLVVAAPCPWQAVAARSRRGSGRSSRRWWSVRHSGRASPTRKERRRRDLRSAQGGRGTHAFSFCSRARPPVQPRFRRARPLFLLPESDFKLGRASSRHGGRITVRARPTRPPRWPRNLRLFSPFPFFFLVPPPIQPRFRRPWTPFLARIGT
jgi:hypothetical protein